MSFDLFYRPCRLGAEPTDRKNPFTGAIQASLPVLPLTSKEVAAVHGVLAGAGARGPDEFGCFVVELGDGGEAEVFASEVEAGCMVAVRGLTADLLLFLFDLLRAADWALLPAMEGNPAIVTSAGLARAFANDTPEVVCGSREELGAILSGSFEAWSKFGDRVVGEHQDD